MTSRRRSLRPIGFTQGLTGALFPIAVTLAGAVVISGFIALTLSPMIAARVLKGHQGHAEGTSRFQRIVDRSFDAVSAGLWPARDLDAPLPLGDVGHPSPASRSFGVHSDVAGKRRASRSKT